VERKVEEELPLKQGLKLDVNVFIGCLGVWVEEELPLKQGLKRIYLRSCKYCYTLLS